MYWLQFVTNILTALFCCVLARRALMERDRVLLVGWHGLAALWILNAILRAIYAE